MRTLHLFFVILLLLSLLACKAEVKTVESCGDGVLDPDEQCDGDATSAGNCEDLGFYQQTGDLVCRADCTLDTKVCLSRCDDDVIQTAFGEQCEGDDLAAETCETLGLGAGTLGCNAACRYDTSACENDLDCGDGVIIERFEDCEGEDLAGQTCESLGYYGGDLACDPYTCVFALSGCENFGRCGDNAVQATYAEECDGSELGGVTCESLGYYGGQLTCDTGCHFDTDDCAAHGRCGDGLIQDTHGEICETNQLGDATCVSLGWYGGELACGADCTALNESCCAAVGRCGDGLVQETHDELCDGAELGGVSCRDFDFFTGELACTDTCVLDEGACVNATQVSARQYFACARLTDGTARCWGRNPVGQLGDGTTTDRLTPVTVSGLSDAAVVVAGGSHTCALLGDGTVRCWGFNANGQLGNGATTNSAIPVSTVGLTGAVELALGWDHACARLGDGTVRCWGYNAGGQLGDGSTDNRVVPVTVNALAGAVSISAGNQHTCAVLDSGIVKCWGVNTSGQLGDGTNTRHLTPVQVSGLTNAVEVAAGFNHTCARLADGTARCWGYNYFGQLGNGTTSSSSSPVVVTGLAGVAALTLGYSHSCARLTDGTLRCWGHNNSYELGDGTNIHRYTPVATLNLDVVTSFTLGEMFTCAVPSSGIPQCWGYNEDGELGNGTLIEASAPTPVGF